MSVTERKVEAPRFKQESRALLVNGEASRDKRPDTISKDTVQIHYDEGYVHKSQGRNSDCPRKILGHKDDLDKFNTFVSGEGTLAQLIAHSLRTDRNNVKIT